MTTIDIDGLVEEEFRRSVESKLRHGEADAAAERLRALLAPYAAGGRILPERFLTIDPAELSLTGWEGLGDRLRRNDRPWRPVTAISIAFGWPGDHAPRPDSAGQLRPLVETGYYTDDAFPFSRSDREDLLEGYSYFGCTWSGDCEATDTEMTVRGIDDLNGALAMLESRLLASEEPDEEGIRAGSLGACLLSVLLFQAVRDRIARDGLPRPLCVLSGSNGIYPYFDAPVAGIAEDARLLIGSIDDNDADLDLKGAPAPRYSSLLMTGIPRARKRAVLVLEETEEEAAVRIAHLRGQPGDADASDTPPPTSLPGPAAPAPDEASPAELPPGLLLTKKPTPQTWDFRDLLSPRETEPRFEASPPDRPVPDPAPPTDRSAVKPLPQPGFTLFELPPAEFVPPARLREPTPVTGDSAPEAPPPILTPTILIPAIPGPDEPAPVVPIEPEGFAWPFDLAWQDEEFEEAETAGAAPAADEPGNDAAGLWARLRMWMRRRA